MSEINANFVVTQTPLTVTTESSNITVDTDPINLNVFALGFTAAAGQPGNLQYNDNGGLGGAANTVVSAGNVRFTNISNLKIANGSNGYFLQTDGTGNLTWAPGTANITGNKTAAGANTQIQFTDGAGNFLAAPGFTFDNSTNVFSTPGNIQSFGNITASSNVSANYFIGDGSQLTGIVAANIAVGNADSNSNTIFYPIFVSGLGNVQPQVDNFGNVLTYVPSSGTLNTNILDITEIKNSNGNVLINDNLDAFTILANGNITANYFIGNGAYLTGIDTSLISNGNSNVRVFANGNVTISSNGVANVVQANSSQVTINGNLNANVVTANLISGTLTTAAQPNITSVGNLTSLTVTGNITAGNANLGNLATANYFSGDGGNINNVRSISNGSSSITIPTANGNILVNPGGGSNLITFSNVGLRVNTNDIVLGANAKSGTETIAIGKDTLVTNPGSYGIGIGSNAGRLNQGTGAVAIGRFAGETNANSYTVAVGYGAGQGFLGSGQSANAVAVGYNSGINNQGTNAVALGSEAGSLNQGADSIAIGKLAGYTNQANNSIVLNATGTSLSPSTANSFVVKPIRNTTSGNVLQYDQSTGEIVYNSALSIVSLTTSGNIIGNNLTVNNFANVSGNLRSNNLTVTNFANVSGNLTVTNFANVTGNVNANNISVTNNLSTANGNITTAVITTANISNLNLVKYQETVINGGNTGAATLTPNAAAGTIYQYTLTGNITLSTLANAAAGTSMTIILTQDGVGNRLLTSTMKFAGNVRTLSTVPNSIDIMSVFYDGSTYYAALSKGYA